jgi:hypothetical protein
MKGSEVRDLLHIGRTTLHDWRLAGRLTAIRHHDKSPWPPLPGLTSRSSSAACFAALGALR